MLGTKKNRQLTLIDLPLKMFIEKSNSDSDSNFLFSSWPFNGFVRNRNILIQISQCINICTAHLTHINCTELINYQSLKYVPMFLSLSSNLCLELTLRNILPQFIIQSRKQTFSVLKKNSPSSHLLSYTYYSLVTFNSATNKHYYCTISGKRRPFVKPQK